MRILGIDPGTAIVGYSVIDFEKRKYKVLDYGCIYTDKDEDMPVRLEKIYDGLDNIIKLWNYYHSEYVSGILKTYIFL